MISSAASTVRSPSQSITSPSSGRSSTPRRRGDEVEQGDGRHRHLVQRDQHPGAEDQEDLLADAEQGADGVEDVVLAAVDQPPASGGSCLPMSSRR